MSCFILSVIFCTGKRLVIMIISLQCSARSFVSLDTSQINMVNPMMNDKAARTYLHQTPNRKDDEWESPIRNMIFCISTLSTNPSLVCFFDSKMMKTTHQSNIHTQWSTCVIIIVLSSKPYWIFHDRFLNRLLLITLIMSGIPLLLILSWYKFWYYYHK